MRLIGLLAFCVFMLFITPVNAETITQFNDSTTTQNVVLNETVSALLYIRIPKNASFGNFTMSFINVSGFNATADGEANASYGEFGGGVSRGAPESAYDEDFYTKYNLLSPAVNAYAYTEFYENMTLNITTPAPNWSYRVSASGNINCNRNFTVSCYDYLNNNWLQMVEHANFFFDERRTFILPTDCTSQNPLQIFTNMTLEDNTTTSCSIGSEIGYYDGEIDYGFEHPHNLTIDAGNDDVNETFFSELNTTNSPQEVDLNHTSIRQFLVDCYEDVNNFCDLPINISAQSAGIVQLDNINISYEFIPFVECDAVNNVRALNFSLFKEENRTINLSGDFQMAITSITSDDLSGLNSSFSFEDQTYFEICMAPAYATYTVDATIEYNASGYSTRHYYLVNAELSNQTNNISLYSLESIFSQEILFTVKDVFNSPENGVVLKTQRFFIGTNEYVQVAMGKSDFGGETVTSLKPNNFYVFILEREGAVLRSFEPKFLTTSDTSIELKTSQEGVFEHFDYDGSVATSCSYNNDTYILRCTATDTSGFMQEVFLRADIIRLNTTYENVCDVSGTGSSVILTCDLTAADAANETVYYTFRGSFCCSATTIDVFATGVLILKTVEDIWQNFGPFVLLLMMIPVAFVGRWNPSVSIILIILVSWMGFTMNLLPQTELIFVGLMSFAVVGGIIIWRLKI